MISNANRLTTPYDLHITLRHILELSTGKKITKKAIGCRKCKSLFDEIHIHRRCSDVHIPHDSCPCSLQELKTSKPVVGFAANHAVNVLNEKLSRKKAQNGEKCATLKLKQVISANQQLTSQWNMNYIVHFEVTPSKARFEALMRRKFISCFEIEPEFELLQEIKQIDSNQEAIVCVPESGVEISRKLVEDEDSYYEL